MAQDLFPNRGVNLGFWPGPNAAGMGKATNPPVQAGADTQGMHDTVWNGRNCAGAPKAGVNIGPNAAGQPDIVSKS